jgi:hypothetical protein
MENKPKWTNEDFHVDDSIEDMPITEEDVYGDWEPSEETLEMNRKLSEEAKWSVWDD